MAVVSHTGQLAKNPHIIEAPPKCAILKRMEHLDVPALQEAIARLQLQLNNPVSEPDVASFEQKHGISLPPDYREFITRVGNGGAGPFYGVFALLYGRQLRYAPVA